MTELVPNFAFAKSRAEVFAEVNTPHYVRCQSFSFAMDSLMWNNEVRTAVLAREDNTCADVIIGKRSSDHYLLMRRVGKLITAIELDVKGLMHTLPSFWGRDVAVCFDEARTSTDRMKAFMAEDVRLAETQRG